MKIVTYKLIRRGKRFFEYAYYPDGNEEKAPGTIVVDSVKKVVWDVKGAECDSLFTCTPAMFNELRDQINEALRIIGKEELAKKALPMPTRPITVWEIGQYAVDDIMAKVRNGEIPEKGTVTLDWCVEPWDI